MMYEKLPAHGLSGVDGTIGAINEITRTMGGSPAADAETAACRQATPHQTPAQASALPEQLNVNVEAKLVELGVFGKRSTTQRQVLGCLACRLGTNGEPPGQFRSMEIARCNNKDNGSIIRVLRKLIDADILTADSSRKETRDDQMGKPPILYSYTARTVDTSFRRALRKPVHCGLEGGPKQLNRPAEDLLLEAGVIVQRSDVGRTILGCLACRLGAGQPGIYTTGVSECTGFRRTSILKALDPMVASEALRIDTEEGRHIDGRPRRNYQPADTELGRDLAAVLEAPGQCRLKTG